MNGGRPYIEEAKTVEVPEERCVGIQVVRKANQTRVAGVYIREGDHRGGRTSGGHAEKRKLVDEIAQRGLGG